MNCVSEGDRFLPPQESSIVIPGNGERKLPGNGDILPKSGSRKKHKRQPRNRLALNFLKEALFGLVGAAARPARLVANIERQKSTLCLPGQRKSLPLEGKVSRAIARDG